MFKALQTLAEYPTRGNGALPSHRGGLFLLISLLWTGCGESVGSSSGMAREADFVCTVEIVPTGVALRGDSTGETAPVPPVARLSDGRMVTGNRSAAEVLVWSAQGELESRFGREGAGPGELARGPLTLLVLPGDTLLVRDNRMRLHTFLPSGTFLGSTLERGLSVSQESTHPLADGRLLATHVNWPIGSDSAIMILERSGEVSRRFGPLSRTLAARRTGQRFSTYAGGTDFWVAPGDDAERGYVLEHWDTAGRLLDTLMRTASWLGEADTSWRARGLTSFPFIRRVHVDSSGLLFVTVVTIPPPGEFGERPPIEQVIDRAITRLDVIDPVNATVVASIVVPQTLSPQGMFAGSRIGYRAVQDSAGDESIRMLRLDLVASDGSHAKCVP